MKLSQLKEFIKTVVKEEQDYEELFQSMLAKTGKNIPDMSDDEKKKFFNDVDDSYKAKSESTLTEKVDMDELEYTLKRVKKENPGKKVGYSFIQDAPKGYKISIDGKYVNESVNESDMDAKLPKDLLIQVVEALIIQVITQASTRKINIPASDIESLRNNLKKEINSGKITTVGQIMKTIQRLHPMRESVRKGVVKEARLRRQGNGGQLNELGILGSAIAIALGLTGAYALIKGSSWVKEKLGDASYDLLKKLDTQLKAKKAIEDKAQLMDTIKPMIDRLSEDAKLKQLYAELPEWGSSISKRQTKINAERAKQLRKIGEYIKSKLTEDEAKYFSAISQFFRKGTLDELIKEARLRRQGNGGQLNELGILGSAIAIALGLTGAYALIKGSSWVKEKLGDASYDLLKKLDTQLKAKKAIEDKAQLMDTIKPMIDRLSEDAKLKQLYAELPEWGSSISKRQTKINAERAKQLRKIGEYIKSKLTEDEAKYFSAISQFFRKGTLDELIKEAAFRTLFTHPIWKKAGVNYVDSNFVNDCKNKIPLSELVHLGMGDFMLKTPHGDISFDRVSYQFDGMSGRAHKMTGNKELMDMLIKKMRAQVVHSESVNKSIKKKINEWSSNDVLALLGGKRFLATSGAYAMSGNVAQKTAKFNFKTSGKNGINNVWITETSPDTYTINFIKVEGEDVNISPIKNVSGDKLKSIFTKYTGLKTP